MLSQEEHRGLSAEYGAWDSEIIKDEGHKVETLVQPKASGGKMKEIKLEDGQ